MWGAVYELTQEDLARLDKSEGFIQVGSLRNAYERRQCEVFPDGREDCPLTVFTYFAIREDNPPLPAWAYREQIIAGAKFWHLPVAYLESLEAIPVQADCGKSMEIGRKS